MLAHRTHVRLNGERVPDSTHEETGFVQKAGRPPRPGAGAREQGGSDGSLGRYQPAPPVAPGSVGLSQCRGCGATLTEVFRFCPGCGLPGDDPGGWAHESATAVRSRGSSGRTGRGDGHDRRRRIPSAAPRGRRSYRSNKRRAGSGLERRPTRTGSSADSGSGRCGLLLRAPKQPGSWSRSSWFAPVRHATGCARPFSCAG